MAGRLGVFSYSGAGEPGELCLFVPDDPTFLGGKPKLRPGPGATQRDGDTLRLVVRDGWHSYTWKIGSPITSPAEVRAFINHAEASDRIIRHLLEGARLLGE